MDDREWLWVRLLQPSTAFMWKQSMSPSVIAEHWAVVGCFPAGYAARYHQPGAGEQRPE